MFSGEFERISVSWQLVRRDGSIIMPEEIQTGDDQTYQISGGGTVHVRWRTDEKGARLGTLCYSGLADIEFVQFPYVVYKDFPDNGTLLLPRQYGSILHNVNTHLHTAEEYSNEISGKDIVFCGEMVPMRGSAMMTDTQSYLFDFRDPGWMLKTCIYTRPAPKTLAFFGRHFVPMSPGRTAYALPYECGITAFNGGWFEAAKLYRRWALTQPWVTNKHADPRMRDISCFCWNRGLIDNVLPPVLRLSEDTGTKPALSWYWWHHNPYDTDYPDYWPPREGEEPFKNAVAELNKRGLYCQVYINGMTWDMDGTSTWEGGEDAIIVRRNGDPEAFPYNTFNHHRLGSICGTAKEFQRRICAEVDHLVKAGLPAVYIDMIGNATHRACYHTGHGHAPGGGDYNYRGYREMIKEIKRRYPDLLLSTEDCGEDFMDLMDSFIGFHISLERFHFDPDVECVPLYPAIYHGIMPMYGSYTLPDGIPPYDPSWPEEGKWKNEKDWINLFPDQFYLEIARQVMYGNIPTLANFQLKHCEEERFRDIYRFICETIRFRQEHLQYLFDGEMLRPPVIQCPEIDVDFMARFIYTHEDAMKTPRHRRPVIFGSRWRAPDGSEATLLVNWSREDVRFTCDGQELHMPPRSYLAI